MAQAITNIITNINFLTFIFIHFFHIVTLYIVPLLTNYFEYLIKKTFIIF